MKNIYYKTADNSAIYCVTSKIKDLDLIEITEEEYNSIVEQRKEASKKAHEATAAAREIELKIAEIERKLADTDYIAIKYAEGIISEDDYSPVREKRQKWRQQIKAYEKKQA